MNHTLLHGGGGVGGSEPGEKEQNDVQVIVPAVTRSGNLAGRSHGNRPGIPRARRAAPGPGPGPPKQVQRRGARLAQPRPRRQSCPGRSNRRGRPEPPFWTQHRRKYANQPGLSSSVAYTTRYGTVVVALAKASEETRVKMMSKLPYQAALAQVVDVGVRLL